MHSMLDDGTAVHLMRARNNVSRVSGHMAVQFKFSMVKFCGRGSTCNGRATRPRLHSCSSLTRVRVTHARRKFTAMAINTYMTPASWRAPISDDDYVPQRTPNISHWYPTGGQRPFSTPILPSNIHSRCGYSQRALKCPGCLDVGRPRRHRCLHCT